MRGVKEPGQGRRSVDDEVGLRGEKTLAVIPPQHADRERISRLRNNNERMPLPEVSSRANSPR